MSVNTGREHIRGPVLCVDLVRSLNESSDTPTVNVIKSNHIQVTYNFCRRPIPEL
jgi:hypothetical protein